MAKKQKETPKVTIEGKEYEVDKLLDEQKMLINHINDLDNKLNSARFNIVQMQFGRDSFYDKLKDSLGEEVSE